MHCAIEVCHVRVTFVAMGPKMDRYTVASMLCVVHTKCNFPVRRR
jgi:hypothetical protein